MDFTTLADDVKKITYSGTYNKPLQNTVIKLFEKSLVRTQLAQRFFQLVELIEQGQEIETAALQAFGLQVNIAKGAIDLIPPTGSVLVVGNHPFGIVDGMVVASVIRSYRQDIKVLAHQGISNLPQFSDFFLPINFDQSEGAKVTNKQSIAAFKEHLARGGIGVIFPAGAVSTRRPLWRRNCDPPWHVAAAKWATDNNCQVVPVFIDGACGPLFQLSSQFSMTLRLSSLLYENSRRIDSQVDMRIGDPIDLQSLPATWDLPKVIQFLRQRCYALAHKDPWGRPIGSQRSFREFHKARP
jgi:putative hemolysin